jgi:hypothetical protein
MGLSRCRIRPAATCRGPPFVTLSTDGHHIQVCVADFSGPYQQLLKRGLISEESDQHQYSFKDIIDPYGGKVLFTIEHEVRSMKRPIHMRPLVNRNLAQNNINYVPGFDASTST